MKNKKVLLLCLCSLIAVTPAAFGQAQVAAAVIGGTVNVTITITVKTTTLANFTCSADVLVQEVTASGALDFEESDTVVATGTGSTRTCKLSIPYSWSLATPSTDNMVTSYTVLGSSTATNGLPQRTSARTPLDTRKVPATGTTTTLAAAVVQ